MSPTRKGSDRQIAYHKGRCTMYFKEPLSVVNVANSLVKADAGKYFLGESEFLNVGRMNLAWTGLINPYNSGVNLYLDIFVSSNMSPENMLAKIWFCSIVPPTGKISPKVTSANLAYQPKPIPRGQIQSGEGVNPAISAGTAVSTRLILASTTVTSEKHGHWIIGPGTCILFSYVSQGTNNAHAVMAFGWWEECVHQL